MSFILEDQSDETRKLRVNSWNWHPTVELISSLGIIDAERIELLHLQCVGATISETEAHLIAQRLQDGVLSKLRPNERVTLDLTITDKPDDGTLHKEPNAHENYSATEKWLTLFAQFCQQSKGIKVY